MPTTRSSPYIWVTWLSKLLSGEAACEWASWFKAHYERGSYSQMPSTFDHAGWQLNHTRLVGRIRERLEGEARSVSVEAQNQFTLAGRVATVGGRPDIISASGDSVTVCDAKTGQPRVSDQVQVMAYMYAVPLAFPDYRGMPVRGLVIYEDHEVNIPPEAVDGSFKTDMVDLIHKLSGDEPPRKVPSGPECGFCDITAEDCAERIESVDLHTGSTDDF